MKLQLKKVPLQFKFVRDKLANSLFSEELTPFHNKTASSEHTASRYYANAVIKLKVLQNGWLAGHYYYSHYYITQRTDSTYEPDDESRTKKISSFCQQKTSALHQNASPACGQREIRAAAAHNSSQT